MRIDPNHVPAGAVALPVSDGTWTLVDADVAEALQGRRLRRQGKYVFVRQGRHGLALHRVVAGQVPGKDLHHRNGCRADNRRENLEHLTRGEHNRLHFRRTAASGFPGVSLGKRPGRFHARLFLDARRYFGPTLREPLLCALCRDDLMAAMNVRGARHFDRRISPGQLLALLDSTAGRFFTVWFVKRSNGEIRRMTCRLRKKADSQGLKFDPRAVGLITVWDVQAREYRCINLEGVLCLRMEGKFYRVEHRRAVAA